MIKHFRTIDKIIDKIDKLSKTKEFFKEVKRRNSLHPPKTISDERLLENFTTLIAFGGQARSDKVKEIIDAKIFNEVLFDFNIAKVAKSNPCDLIDKHWNRISSIRYQTKVFQLVMFARRIQRIGNLPSLIINSQIPKRIAEKKDIDEFWIRFKKLKKELKNHKVSHLSETTTLLHYLLDAGYDCVKPDSAVMKAAEKIGIVEKSFTDTKLQYTVRVLQEYGLYKKLRPSIIDLYLLIEGEQKAAVKYLVK